jgi:hypothetical protein
MIRFGLTLLLPVCAVLACGGADHSSPFIRPSPAGSGGKPGAMGGEGGEMPMPPAAGGSASGGSQPLGGEGGVALGGSDMGGMGAMPDLSCDSDLKLPPDDVPFVCSPPGSIEALPTQPIATGAGWVVGATPDELVLVWGSPGATRMRYFIAERGTPVYDFGEQVELAVTDSPLALSADGLRLTLVDATGKALKEVAREARGDLFGEPSEGPYANLNDRLAMTDETILALVVAPDDLSLAYVTFDTTSGESTLAVGARSANDAPFELGEAMSTCETVGDSEGIRYPTSFSADGLTLFYYDQVRGATRAAYREALDQPFRYFVDMPSQSELFVNQDCTRAFLTAPAHNAAVTLAELKESPLGE